MGFAAGAFDSVDILAGSPGLVSVGSAMFNWNVWVVSQVLKVGAK